MTIFGSKNILDLLPGDRLGVDNEIDLRLPVEADAPEMFRVIHACRPYLREWLPWLDTVTDVGDSMLFIAMQQQRLLLREGFQMLILYKGEMSGVVGFNKIDWDLHSAALGYWLAQDCQRQGIMTRACERMVRFAFTDLRLERLEIRCAEHNARSRAIPERLGFRTEGYIPEAEWLYDHYVDHIVYTAEAPAWLDAHPQGCN